MHSVNKTSNMNTTSTVPFNVSCESNIYIDHFQIIHSFFLQEPYKKVYVWIYLSILEQV